MTFSMSTKNSACQNCGYAIFISQNELQVLSYPQAHTSNLYLQTSNNMHLVLRQLLLSQLNQLLYLLWLDGNTVESEILLYSVDTDDVCYLLS